MIYLNAMTNEDMLQDLKQFITITFSQQTTDIRGDIGDLKQEVGGLKQGVKRLDAKIDDLSGSVANAIDTGNDVHGKQLKNHEKRITSLEKQAA